MPKAPAFQFYADKFLTGTMAMTLAERGAYITLLCYQWEHGAVPGGDMAALSRVLGTTIRECETIWQSIQAKFKKCSHGKFRNPRLEHERRKQREYRKQQSVKGLAGARVRWRPRSSSRSTGHPPATKNRWPKHGSSSPTTSTSPKDQDRVRRAEPRTLNRTGFLGDRIR